MGSATSCTASKHNESHVAQKRADESNGSSHRKDTSEKEEKKQQQAAAHKAITPHTTHPVSAPPTTGDYIVEPPASAAPRPHGDSASGERLYVSEGTTGTQPAALATPHVALFDTAAESAALHDGTQAPHVEVAGKEDGAGNKTPITTPSTGLHPAVHDASGEPAALQESNTKDSGRHCHIDALSPPQHLVFNDEGEEVTSLASLEVRQTYQTLQAPPQTHHSEHGTPLLLQEQQQEVINLQQHVDLAPSNTTEAVAPPPPLPLCSPQIFPYNLPQPGLLAAKTDRSLCVHKDMLWCVKRADQVWLLYNVTLTHSVKVKLSFAASAELQLDALGVTELTQHPTTRAWTATLTCPPHEVCPFLRFTLKAHPLVHEGISARIIARSLQAIPYNYGDLLRTAKATTTRAERELNALLAECGRPRVSLTLTMSQRQAQSSTEDEEAMVLARCVSKQMPFVDLTFPPCQRSITGAASAGSGGASAGSTLLARLGLSNTKTNTNGTGSAMRARLCRAVVWARPTHSLAAFDELPALVRLFRGPVSGLSVAGNVVTGNAWLLGAMACLAEALQERVRDLFRHPESVEQGQQERALGAYRVTLNKNGWWTNVIVDDYLPVLGSWPLYARSGTDCCEVWVSILEKAYAKLCGGYECISTGDPLVALQDMTGFPCSRYDNAFAEAMKDIVACNVGDASTTPPASQEEQTSNSNSEGAKHAATFFERLARFLRRGYLVLLTTPTLGQLTPEGAAALDEAGLLVGHTYLVRRVHSPATSAAGEYAMEVSTARSVAFESRAEPPASLLASDTSVASPPTTSLDLGSQDNETGRMSGQRPSLIYMNAIALQRCFSGCGVCFRHTQGRDCRVRGAFVCGLATVCPLISVTENVFVTFTLALPPSNTTNNVNTRVSSSSSSSAVPGSATRQPGTGTQAERNTLTGAQYHPMLMSLCETTHSANQENNNNTQGNEALVGSQLRVVCHSSLDADCPLPKTAFIPAGQQSIRCVLTADHSPYLIVPRLMSDNDEKEEEAGRAVYTKSDTGVSNREGATVPYVVGIMVDDSQNDETASHSKDTKVRIDFVTLPDAARSITACQVSFSTDGMQPVQTCCQVRTAYNANVVTSNDVSSVTL